MLDQPNRFRESDAIALPLASADSLTTNDASGRLRWPASAAIIIGASAALWGLIALAARALGLL